MTSPARHGSPALAAGSVSLRLYPHDLPAGPLLAEMERQAVLAVTSGFDGVMVSERHGGIPGSVPNPLQVAGWLLAAMPHGWAAACPLLLPLRCAAVVAEEVAWLAVRFPGRVGIGFASGGNRRDFDLHGVPFDSRGQLYDEQLRAIVDFLRNPSSLGGDRAIESIAERPIPILTAALSPRAARRAAELGIGIIDSSLPSLTRIAELHARYRAAGGHGPHVLIRRVWVGPPPTDETRRQLDAYRQAQEGQRRTVLADDDQLICAADPDEVVHQLIGAVRASGADALNLRVHVAGIVPAAAREQIEILGSRVVPRLRAEWPARSDRAVT